MRRFLIFDLFIAPLLICVLFFISEPVAAQRPTNPNGPRPPSGAGTIQPHIFSVGGMVSDAESHTRIDGVRVDLRAFTGGIVATAFTSGNGNFQFNNIPGGSYEVVVEQVGYQAAHQQVAIQGTTLGIMIELRPLARASVVPSGNPTVSKRELSIPHKAHDAMEKGLALLYGKSDYQGSVKQFERATQEYPDYYEAYTEMGVAYMKLGDAANSERTLRKALDLSEQHYEATLFWLASLLSNGQRFAEAEQLARKGVELNANSWEANSELARALLGLGRAAEAEPNALAAVKLRPENANLQLMLANIHIALQNNQALLDDLNAYLKLAPTGPFAGQVRKQRDELQQELQKSQASPPTPSGQNPSTQ
jgi:Tfp pilus assembly protein PilF